MDRNECRGIEHKALHLPWVRKYMEIRETKLCDWVSTFHPERLNCHTVEPSATTDSRGAFNIVCKIKFDTTGETWAVRFPQHSIDLSVSDEKVEAEVAAINIVREQTDIPVPEIKAWGLARDNPLGLGPFIMSAWVDGIRLSDVLIKKRGPGVSRLIDEDVSVTTLERLWRQIARFILQMSRINFDVIGSCSKSPRRPWTCKLYEIMESAVQPSWPSCKTFTSTIEYFNLIADHDLRQLHDQPNSVDDEDDARQKYIKWTVMRQLVPRFVTADHGPFKMICDDFGPMNMLVNNDTDLEIVAVIDWEWTWAGPPELFWSPPLWLIGLQPVSWANHDEDACLERYLQSLDVFIRVLAEEETKIAHGCEPGTRPSELLRQCQRDGSMWFYHILQQGYNGPTSVLFRELRASISDWDELVAAVSTEETEAFVRKKMEHLRRYEEELAETKRRYPHPWMRVQ
ncbi:unnamed protein product [Zymoseptoria tritici ST99CH_1A5]|uniref:Aminoglycoside phosphotransferase domain-containing protein n=1 Tax=Zymoseptoria tritici ST99CH_1A5 TaxID=1276529 RepID=A0A1Y6LK65_ZYMTR|nr:unnamed protein product [Zymoseptoria tritici ST99CH_1A5]